MYGVFAPHGLDRRVGLARRRGKPPVTGWMGARKGSRGLAAIRAANRSNPSRHGQCASKRRVSHRSLHVRRPAMAFARPRFRLSRSAVAD